ncbi:lipopolysaccharide biosynthesis protein [Microbispora sp. NPDC049125]|uniref:lipopolysaccharide biosynthesis protein n=1 Tax=Microbispora sp. NPDC049125 TaxID=3154929 RepID=UPI0034655CA4
MTETIPRTPAEPGAGPPAGPQAEAGARRRLPAGLGDPLFRNAYALMVNAGASGVLGLVYWVLAARLYDTADGGRAMAVIGAMRLLAALTSFGFVGTLTRFIADTGRSTGKFIAGVYIVSAGAAAAATVVFLLTIDHWGDNYRDLSGAGPGLLFIGAVLTWVVFTLQDVALTGLRKATWVPIENITFGIAKIVLLVVLAETLPGDGITVSWVVPVAVTLLPVNLLIFRKLVPEHKRETEGRRPPTVRKLSRFLAGDYLGSTFVLAITYLLPVIVGAYVDATTYNYYYSAGMLGAILELLAITMATSLTVEGAFDAASLAANGRRALVRTFVILCPIVLGTVLLAPYLMAAFSPGHAEHATTLLRLTAIATLPRALVELYLGVLRAKSRPRRLAYVQGGMCTVAFAATMLLLPRLGINGVGLALLLAQLATAVVITPPLLRTLVVTGGGAAGARPYSIMDLVTTITDRAASAWRRTRVVPAIRAERARRWLLPLLAAEGFAIYLLALVGPLSSLTGVDPERMNGLGLISVIPRASLAGLALLIGAFFATLAQRRYRPVLLLLQLFAITFCLHGASALVSAEPRFPTAWLHVGFIEYIARTGGTLPGLDARFSWPGFFAVFAFVSGALGMENFREFVNWVPVVSNLLYLVPLLLILRRMRADRRAKWLAAVLFVTMQWIGQDYFSPQGTTYLFYLLFLAILVTWFGRQESRPEPDEPAGLLRRIGRHLDEAEPGEFLSRPADKGTRIALYVVLLILGAATTATHQITPFMMVSASLGLVLLRRCSLSTLPWLIGGFAVAWVSYLATPYWYGHLGDMMGGIGSLVGNLTANTTGRFEAATGDPLHPYVLKARLGFAGILVLMAGLGMARRLRRKVMDRVALVLTVTPVTAMALQSYGGEMGLRVYFFMLPGACILAAYAFFPESPGSLRGMRQIVGRPSLLDQVRAKLPMPVAFVAVLALAGGFFVTRYGNEQFERVTTGEAQALDYIYARDRPSARVLLLAPGDTKPGTVSSDITYSVVPWREKDVERVEWLGTPPPANPADVGPIVSALRGLGPGSFLLTMRSQDTMLEVTDPLGQGIADGWGDRMRASLSASPDLVTLFADGDAAVYTLRRQPPGSVPPSGDYTLTPPGFTSWTPVGLAALALYAGLLVTLELMSINGTITARRRRRLLRVTAFVTVVAIAVVIERFASLGL